MAMIASTLVQETTLAERRPSTAARGGASSSGGAPDEFAGLLQGRSKAAEPTRADHGLGVGPAAQAAQTAQATQMAQRTATQDRAAATLATRAPAEPPQRPTPQTAAEPAVPDHDRALAEPEAHDPAAARTARAAAARATANRSAVRSAAAEEADRSDASVRERETSALQDDGATQSLAQWLMQMGVIPALGALGDLSARGDDAGGVAAPGSTAAAGELAGLEAAAGPAGLGRVYRRPAPGEPALAAGESTLSGAALRGRGSAGGMPEPAPAGGREEPGAAVGALAGSPALQALADPERAADGAAYSAAPAGLQGPDTRAAAAALDAQAGAQSAGLLGAAGLLTGSAAAAASTPGAAAPVEVTVQASFEDPGAAGEVVMQLGRLVREGVTQASLHLNPAEMGPIRVQITLDGSQARIDFAASHAATRELIEASLPALALSLQEDGLTLSDSRVGSVSAAEAEAAAALAGGYTASGGGLGGDMGRGAPPRSPERDAGAPGARPAAQAEAGAAAPADGSPAAADALAGRATARWRALDLYA